LTQCSFAETLSTAEDEDEDEEEEDDDVERFICSGVTATDV